MPQNALTGWDNFYVIVGSSAAALTGLQFVVMALVAEARSGTTEREIGAFSSPTIFYFCLSLFISAILTAPWPSLIPVSIAIVLTGAAGIGYGAVVIRRTHLQMLYKPVLEDWIWHTALPMVANACVIAGALALLTHASMGLFLIAGGSLALLFVGIHNSWDTVTYIVTKANEGARAR
jgi:hypothetical protein